MKEITLVDQVMDSLAFEVEEVPQDGQISSASSNSPLNVKIRIRKKNRKVLPDGGIISIPKNDHTAYDSEKVRVTSSDQTIMSFNVLMDRGQFIKKRPPKQKRIMQLFKRGGCLGVQNDEDQYEYSIITPQQAHKENELPETMESLSKEGLDKANFTLAKNYSNTEVLQANKQKHTDFLGKCKPGGCLDPPFGEDTYPYLPKFIDVAETNETETKTKINECECKENPPANTKVKSRDEDKIDYSPIVEKENTVPIYDSNASLAQIKSSNSIITFPSILLSTEALNKLQIQKRTKSHSGSRESKSYNLSNQLLETYYISSKVKTIDQEPKSATDSKPNLDTKNVDIYSMKDQENVLHDTKPEPYIISDTELNKEVEHGGRIALLLTKDKIITDDTMNNITEGDKTVLLKDQENGMETPRTPLMEKHETAVINVIPESSPLNTHDSTIFFDKEKFDDDKKYLDKLDAIPESNLQKVPKKNEERALMSENSTIIALAHDLTEDKTKDIKSATEVPLNKNGQERIYDFYANKTKSVESEELKSKSDIETISLPRDYSSNNETLNAIDVNTKVVPEEINETIVTKSSIESIVAKNKISLERMIVPTQDILYVYEDLPTKEYDPKVSSFIEQEKKSTSNLDILSYSKNIRDDSAKSELLIDKKIVPQNNSFSNEDLDTKTIDVNSLQEFLSFLEPTESTKNKMNFPQEDDSLDTQALSVIETVENANFIEADQPTVLISKDSADKLTELVDEYDNKIEDYVQNGVETKTSAEKKLLEELKSNTVDPSSPMSIIERKEKLYSNSATKLSYQNGKKEKEEIKIESFHTNKSDTINNDDLAKQGYPDTSNIKTVTNSEKVSETHIDVSCVDGDIIDKTNWKLAEKTDLQNIEDQEKSKGGILQDEIYHKDLEVTFSEKIRTESMRTSQNILSKPTNGTKIPVEIELEQSRDKTWDTNENSNTEKPIPSDVTDSKEKHKDLNESLPMNYDDKEVIHLNMAFQSFATDEDGSVIRTLDFSSFSNTNRYPNDNILQFKTIIRLNDGEIKIPIDSDKDLVLQIKTDEKYKSNRDGSMKSFRIFNKPKDNDRGHLLPGNNSTKDNTSTVTNNNEINLQQTLDDVYKDKLLPLHDIIKKLKSDIVELTKQQTLIKEKIYNAKRVQSNPIYTSGKRCGCIEMLFTR